MVELRQRGNLWSASGRLARLITYAVRQIGADIDHGRGHPGEGAETPVQGSTRVDQVVDLAFADQLAITMIVQAKKGRDFPPGEPIDSGLRVRENHRVQECGQHPEGLELLDPVATVGAYVRGADGFRQVLLPPLRRGPQPAAK